MGVGLDGFVAEGVELPHAGGVLGQVRLEEEQVRAEEDGDDNVSGDPPES